MEEQTPPHSREHDARPTPPGEFGAWRPVHQPPIPGEYEPRPPHDAPHDRDDRGKSDDDVKA